MQTISFIGAGKMAEAILQGLLAKKLFEPKNILLSDISTQRLTDLAKQYQIKTTSSNLQAIQHSDLILLAVKPQSITAVLEELHAVATPKQLIMSIAAGTSLQTINPSGALKACRVMPNTPALIGQAASAIAFGSTFSSSEKDSVISIFSAIGSVIEVEEKEINAVTGLSGSGPAFVFNLMQSFIAAGKSLGLSEEIAKQLTYQTFLGSASLAQSSTLSLETLIDQVTSPNGTTASGRKVLENSDVQEVLIKTITQAKVRADELSKG